MICWKFFLATRKFFRRPGNFWKDRKFLVNQIKFYAVLIVSLKYVFVLFLIVVISCYRVIVVRNTRRNYLLQINSRSILEPHCDAYVP